MKGMKIIRLFLMMSVLTSLFSSCITSEETNYLQSINIPYEKQAFQPYKLAVNDLVRCEISTKDVGFRSVFEGIIRSDVIVDESSFTGRVSGRVSNRGNIGDLRNVYQIHKNGKILLPFFGEIDILGYTIEEAEEIVQAKMRESITDAIVSLSLYNNSFYVLSDRGSVRGQYVITKENMTIYEAIAQIGLRADISLDYRDVKVLRKNEDGATEIRSFDLRTKDVVQSEFYYMKPNDMLYFPTSKKSFFSITSLSSFFTTILTPVTFLLMVTKLRFD